MIVSVNQKFLPFKEACIPISDEGFLFGDGVFRTLRVYNGKIEHLDRQLKRFYSDCEKMNLFPKVSKDHLYDLIEKNHAKTGLFRMKILFTRSSCLLITVKKTKDLSDKPAKIIRYPYPVFSHLSSIKTLSFLPQKTAFAYALEKGYDEALLFSPEGYILETAYSNIYWKDKGCIYTPSKQLPLLYGVTIERLEEETLLPFKQVKAKTIPPNAQVFLCNSITNCRCVQEISLF